MPAQKRRAPATPEVEAPSSSRRRRSTRISSTGKKSQYFEGDSSDEDELSTPQRSNGVAKKAKTTPTTTTTKKGVGRPRGRPAKKAVESADEDEEFGQEDSSSSGTVSTKKKKQKDDEYDEGEDELDEDEKPRVTFIPHVKMRDTGGTAYEDDRLHKNTLLFLKDLKANNKRTWLKSNDGEYRRSLKDWNSYVETLMEKIISIDPTIPELPLKDIVFRIYRDIRFSNDPTPYKPHYSVSFSRTGRKGPYACYYVHCEPGGSGFVGGGLWHPDAGHLAKLRAHIDQRPERWRRVLGEDNFRKMFLPGAKKGDGEACVKAFAGKNTENALKTKPKGFDANHRDITLLKLRNFTVGKKIPDSVFTDPDGQEQIAEIIRAMVGYVSFLNDIVMPDPSMDSDSSSEEEEEGEEGDQAEDEDSEDDDSEDDGEDEE